MGYSNLLILPFAFFFFSGNEVSIDRFIRSPVFTISSQSDWLLSDFYGSGFWRINESGQVIQEINYGGGEGPGEFTHPRYIFEFPKENTIIILAKSGVTHVFEANTGKFLDKPTRFLPFNGAVKWDESHYLLVWAQNVMNEKSKPQFILFNAHGGEVDSWEIPMPEWQKEFVYQAVGGYAIGSNKTIYMGSKEKPQIFVYPFKKEENQVWRVKPPKGYQKPPERNISQEEIYNPEKRKAYFESYSRIENIFSIDQTYLVVAWRNARKQKPSFDIYRISDRQLISADNEVEGLIIGATKEFIVTQLQEDDSLPEEQERSTFRKYPISLVE